ncbi:pectinesterase family protein [Acholeplasma granularum]|uniref:pectinesterase family protein n=1 Tax=Acholeplasma granularum TaxID=264635 RepID=UPI0004704A4D|nr:pectinesterase family protein [Acholeplasma granularum]
MNKKILTFIIMMISLILVSCNDKDTRIFTVTFEPNNGDAIFTEEVEKNYKVTEPMNIVKSNFILERWYRDIEFTKPWDFNIDFVESDITLYAKWKPLVPTFYEISFESNGGSKLLPIMTTPNTNLIDFTNSTPLRDSYNFIGWFKDQATTIPVTESDKVTSNITLYAKWELIINYYKVTFESNGGTLVEDLNVAESTLIDEPQVTRVGNYQFDGWYKESTFNTKWHFTTDQVTENIKLYAKWLNVYSVTFNTQGGTLVENQLIADGGLVNIPSAPNRPGYVFKGWSTLADSLSVYDFELPVKKNTILYAIWEVGSPIEIKTEAEFINLINNPDGGNYILTKDLDFDGQKIDVLSTTRTFSGILDGNGFKIKNIDASSSSNKQGVLFKHLTGTIKNLTIENSKFQGGGEASGFIAAHIHGGAVVDNIEFINVSVTNTGNYTALIAGDDANNFNPSVPITISNIIVRNYGDSIVSGNEHTAGLIGYLRVSNVVVNVSNIYFEGNIKSTGATAAFIVGRFGTANISLNVNNAVMRGNLTATKQVASLVGQSISGVNITANKVYFSNTKFTTNETTNNSFVGNSQGTITLTNAFYASETSVFFRDYEGGSNISPNQGSPKLSAEITQNWFNELTFNELFKYENNDIILNRTITVEPYGLIFDLTNMKPLYIVGDLFDIENLIIKLLYTNGQVEEIEHSNPNLIIDQQVLDMNHSGNYEVTVSYLGFERILDVHVVEIESIYTYETDFVSLYTPNQNLDLTNIHVFAKLSNDESIRISQSNLEILTDYDKTTPGNYEVSFKYLEFETLKLNITLLNGVLIPTGDKVIIEVDQSMIKSSFNASNPQFKTVKEALLALKKSNLGQVEKIIYIKNGSYYEKLTIDMPNVRIIGESQTQTILYYDQAAGFEKPEGGIWGTQGSASVAVKSNATNFMMANLTVKNTYDYYNNLITASQGVALVSEADQAIYYKVSFYGVQDTLYAKSGRQWYLDTYIEGAVDYIFGNGGPVFIENSTIHTLHRSNADAVITAYKGFNGNSSADGLLSYGVLFYNNTLTAEDKTPSRKVFFGRPWAQEANVAFIENKIMFDNLDPNHWTSMSGNIPELASFFEFENKNSSDEILAYAPSQIAQVLTLAEKNNWINKDVFFNINNGDLSFVGTFNYDENIQHLISLLTN